MILFQAALRDWPPAAIHDTVASVMSARAFQRSLQLSLAQRLFRWLADGLDALVTFLRGSGPARWIAIVKESIRSVAPRFSARRMVKEYVERMYAPALGRKIEVGS